MLRVQRRLKATIISESLRNHNEHFKENVDLKYNFALPQAFGDSLSWTCSETVREDFFC